MTENPPETLVRTVRAGAVTAGQRFLTRDGTPSAPVAYTVVEHDDFGTPALVAATLDGGKTVRIAFSSSIRVVVDPDADPAAAAVDLIPAEEGTPEAVVAQAAAAHPESPRVQKIAERLGKGLNTKSGSNLQDVSDLANVLFMDLADSAGALKVTALITDQPFDGNFGRWKWIESALALASYIADTDGDISASQEFADRLRTADDAETDPLKAKLAAAVRKRQLNEPNLYDREIARAAAGANVAGEIEWRQLRLGVLLYLRAHGGSQTLSAAELDRRLNNELTAVRALNALL